VYQETLKGLSDTFVSKLNASGNALLYSTFLGQNGVNAADGGQGIAVDSFGHAYVTGHDYAGGLPVNGFSGHSAGCDGYIAKLNTAGSGLIYSTYFGGDSCNLGWNIAVDGNQNAFVSGETSSTNFPTTAGTFDNMCGTDGQCNPVNGLRVADFFITKVDTKLTGQTSLKYSTYLGGSGEERVTYNGSIAVDSAGELVYVTGLTASTNPVDFPIKNAAQPLPGGNADAFITKFDISLPLKPGPDQIVYSTYLGGPGTEIGTGIAADVDGNAYISGASGGTFPSTEGQPGCIDPGVFVAKLGSLGEKKFAMCISGLGQDTGLDLAIDPSGCAYVTGFTESNNYPTVNAFQPLFAGGTGATPSDGFVTKLCSGPDHFKCYDVRAEEGFIPFNVTLIDQFEEERVLIMRPVTLCNPVAKCFDDHNPSTPLDCTQVLNPDDHMVCYETRDDSGHPNFERREVIVSNQFGQSQRLTVLRRTNLLCLPSLKAHLERSP
jgi:Beta-propeller repeat